MFADLQQLLLVFFILLFSMSSVDAQKFKSAVASIQEALNTSGNGLLPEGVEPIVELIDLDSLGKLEKGKEEQLDDELDGVKAYLDANELDGKALSEFITASKVPEGIVLTIKDILLFDSGHADIKEESQTLLDKLSPLIQQKNGKVRVEGHTDNVPLMPGSKFLDNWELSTARASRVAEFIIKQKVAKPENVSVAGYAEYRPVAKNDTLENKAKNRRVDVVLISDFSELEQKIKQEEAEKKKLEKENANTDTSSKEEESKDK